MKPSFAALCIAMALLSGEAISSEINDYKLFEKAENWEISFSDHWNACRLRDSKNLSGLYINITPENGWNIGLTDEGMASLPKKQLTATFTIDGKDVETLYSTPMIISLPSESPVMHGLPWRDNHWIDSSFKDRFSKGRTVEVSVNDIVFGAYTLKGSKKAIEAFNRCHEMANQRSAQGRKPGEANEALPDTPKDGKTERKRFKPTSES